MRGACGLLVIGLLAAFAASAHAADDAASAPLKARFLFLLTQYTSWPDEAFAAPDAPLVIAVVGDPAVAQELRALAAGERVNGRALEVRAAENGAALGGVHLAYLADRGASRDQARALAGQPTLRVAENTGFLEVGDVRIELIKGRVAFDVNLKKSRRMGLKLSAKLVKLASRVE
jgi:hypothetical protein